MRLESRDRCRKKFWPYWHKLGIEGRGMADETAAPAAPPQDSRIETMAYVIGVGGWFVPGLGHALLKMWGRAATFFLRVGQLLVLCAPIRGHRFSSTPTLPFHH